jgi:Flp pilus assembly pilin Flp
MTIGLTFWYTRNEANYNRIVALAQWLHTQFSAVWNQISGALSQVWDYIIGLFNTWYTNFQNNCNRIISAGRSLYTDLARVWTDIENRFNQAKDTIIRYLQNLRNDSDREAQNIVQRILGPFANIKASLEGFFNDVYQAGKNLVQNLIDGIEDMLPDLGGTVDKITDKVASYLPMNSPSKIGPLSRLPKWDDIFVNPLRLSVEKMGGTIEAGLNSIPLINNTYGGAVSNVYEGSQISIGPNNLSNSFDINSLIDEINRRATAQRRARGYIL